MRGRWFLLAAPCEVSRTWILWPTGPLGNSRDGFNGACVSFCPCRQNDSLKVFTEQRKEGQASESTFAGPLRSGWPVHFASEEAVLRLRGRHAIGKQMIEVSRQRAEVRGSDDYVAELSVLNCVERTAGMILLSESQFAIVPGSRATRKQCASHRSIP